MSFFLKNFHFFCWKGLLILYFLDFSYGKTKGCKGVEHSIYRRLEVGICQLSLSDMGDLVSHLTNIINRFPDSWT